MFEFVSYAVRKAVGKCYKKLVALFDGVTVAAPTPAYIVEYVEDNSYSALDEEVAAIRALLAQDDSVTAREEEAAAREEAKIRAWKENNRAVDAYFNRKQVKDRKHLNLVKIV